MAKSDLMDRIVNLAKRRGLVFPSSDIYGGFRSTWDYGPLGVLLKRNVKDAWWRTMVQLRDDVVGLDAAILMAPKVWEASGHLATFTDRVTAANLRVGHFAVQQHRVSRITKAGTAHQVRQAIDPAVF